MIAKFLASDERETSLLVKTGSEQEAMKLQKYMSDQIFKSSGSLNPFYGALLDQWCIGKFYTICFEDDLEALEAAEQCIRDYVKDLNEDFSMGVSGPTGLNQGIPHGGPGKGCLPKPLYNPKAKAVPEKEKDDKNTEENLKKLRDAKKLLKNEGFALVRENKSPLMDPMDQFENYLHWDCGFDWDEIDDLVDTNKEMIEDKLKLGMSFANISASLDDSCLSY